MLGRKNLQLLTNNSLIVKTVQYIHIVSMKSEPAVVCNQLNGDNTNDLDGPHSQQITDILHSGPSLLSLKYLKLESSNCVYM